ncbi:MAG: alpha-galactosidase [Oscillospiraceae bacterium]|nr:alpha-galactosidase [Oscillospiraceae bacterium]
MPIRCSQSEIYPHAFSLDTPNSSYMLGVSTEGLVVQLYYGAGLFEGDLAAIGDRENSPWFPAQNGQTLLDHVPLSYSGAGMADLRPAALSVQWEDGDNIADLRYQSHRVVNGKPELAGMPHIYTEKDSEAKTLILTLTDEKGLEADLYYTIFEDCDAIIRRTVLRNTSDMGMSIMRVMSASTELPDSRMDFLHLHGSWAREFATERLPLGHTMQRIESFRGASGHQHNPFAAVVSKDCTETTGEAYGFSLVYSGNFCIEADVDSGDRLRVNIGLSDRSFRWPLRPGESFSTPEAVLVYSDRGVGAMSRTYHQLYRSRLCRGYWRDRPRPVLLNTWEGVYFDFNRDKLLTLAKSAAEVGIELFVIDDGWFGHRLDDTTSLGDWEPWEDKLGCTLPELVADINQLGMQFGIWVEPEMVSPDSNLYRKHPDWVLCRQGRKATLTRTQLILDLSRKEVQDYIIDAMTKLFSSAPIAYVKWDMNRNMTEIGSVADSDASAGALAHRYMLGLYRILGILTDRFPKILLEGCASGGGRFDPGMLYYSPQIWTSDDSDAIQRLSIQGGASLVYPPSVMSCHVSATPNHQVGRSTPLSTRANVAALGGGFGYELDMTKLSPEDHETVRTQIQEYKAERGKLFNSDFYRLTAPEGMAAFQQISRDGSQVVVTCCRRLYDAKTEPRWLRLEGLDPQAKYCNTSSGEVCTGAALMHKGVHLQLALTDFTSERIVLNRKNK